jgi:hypothetical protein
MTKRVMLRTGVETATIADGETTSSSLAVDGRMPTYVAVPAGFDGTSLKPQGSMDGTTFFDIYEADDTDASAITLTVAASRIYALPTECYFLPHIRFVASAQTGAAVLSVSFS